MTDLFDLPSIRAEMSLFRAGLGPIPKSYINLHEECARNDLPRFLADHSLTALSAELVRDGWGDGMQVLEVKAITPDSQEKTFHWSDSNGGSWFVRGHGSSLVECAPIKIGHL